MEYLSRLDFELAPAATPFVLDLEAFTLRAYFLALLTALAVAAPAADAGQGWVHRWLGDRR